MNTYLERHREIVEEVNKEQKHGLFDGTYQVSSRSGTNYFTMGSYESRVSGGTLCLGFKKSPNHFRPELQTAADLGVLRRIFQDIPEYREELPILNGMLIDGEGNRLGRIVEDVSQGGSVKVKQFNTVLIGDEEQLPDKLRELNPNLNDEELAVASFQVGNPESGKRRMLLDLGGLRYLLTIDEVEKIFPWLDIYENIEEHTVFSQ